jgi:hypothetical protein
MFAGIIGYQNKNSGKVATPWQAVTLRRSAPSKYSSGL